MTVWAMRLNPAGRQTGPEMIQGGVAQTNDLGEFRIANLPEGEYLVIAAQQPQMPFGLAVPAGAEVAAAPTYYPGATERRGARVISSRAGAIVGSLWFSMVAAPAFTVSGVVFDEGGRPLGGAMVTLMPRTRPDGPFVPLMGHADRDGRSQVGGVFPGVYHISATAPVVTSGGGVFDVFEEIVVVDAVGGDDPVILETPSRHTNKVIVGSANVTDVKVVVTSSGEGR